MKGFTELKKSKLIGGAFILLGIMIFLLSYVGNISQEIFGFNELQTNFQDINIISDNILETTSMDPKINLSITGGSIQSIEIDIQPISDDTMSGQIFYGRTPDEFSEQNSKRIELKAGSNKIELKDNVQVIRIDPDNKQETMFRLNSIQVNYTKVKLVPNLIGLLLVVMGAIIVCKKKIDKDFIISLVLYGFLSLYVVTLTKTYEWATALPIVYIIFIVNTLIFIVCIKIKVSTFKVYIFIMLVSVVQMIFITPIFEIPDEHGHFYRSYALSQGNLVLEYNEDAENEVFEPYGVYLPSNLGDLFCVYTEGVENQKVSLGKYKYIMTEMQANEQQESFYPLANTKPYTFTGYLPQSIGIGIAKMLNLPAGFLVYFARLFNGIISLMIILYAMKILPKFKELIFVITMLPTNLQLLASSSPDALINSMSILYIAIILSHLIKKTKVNRLHTILLIGIPVYISGIKIPYIILSLMIFMLNKGNSSDRYYRTKVFTLSLVCAMIVYKLNAMAYVAGEGMIANKGHMNFILSTPIEFALLLFNTFLYYMQYWIETGIGRIALINEPLSCIVIYGFIGLLMITAVWKSIKLDKRQLAIISIYILCLVGGIMVGAFTWFQLPMSIIHGIQGRYFIPIIFPLLIGMGSVIRRFFEIKIETISSKVYVYGVLFLTCYHFIELFSRYYLV